jgi:uncharacterized membrane protein
VSGWLAVAASLLPAGFIVRLVAVWAFVLVCPGAAFLRYWPVRDRLERLVLGVALSSAVALLVAEGLVIVKAWIPWLALCILASLTSVSALGLVDDIVSRGLGRPR